MVEETLYLDLSDELIEAILIQEGAVDHLEAVDEMRIGMSK
jgi:hypothetical protein